jgi:hypothetical protein
MLKCKNQGLQKMFGHQHVEALGSIASTGEKKNAYQNLPQ